MQLTIARDTESLQEALAALARTGKRVGMVPTMGALHDGHLSLIRRIREHCDAVVVTIFVNPKQFGPNEDLAKYPRTLDADIEKIQSAGADIVYAPSPEDIYPAGFSSNISVGELSQIIEGKFRPGHFDGVATVLTLLFLKILPHVAIFGEKDYQQLCVVRKLVADLGLPIEIQSAPTLREADGLAMSSRNVYLSPEERKIAAKIHEILTNLDKVISAGSPVRSALDQGISGLTRAGFKVDYLELRRADTLEALERYESPARLLVAAWLGKTRLIDNSEV